MLALKNIDLASDPAAAWYEKDEIVTVVFATEDGELISREGPNRFHAGDALITGSTGDRWSVARARFDAKYAPLAPLAAGQDGPQDGHYRARPVPVLARQMPQAFSVERCAGGDLLTGVAHDWLLQYAPGDFGLIENARFQQVYRAQKRK